MNFDNIIFTSIFFIFTLSFFIILIKKSYTSKLIGVNILQLSVILFYISLSYITDGNSPILDGEGRILVNPLPHVLMLTAIVVGVSNLAVGVAIILKISK